MVLDERFLKAARMIAVWSALGLIIGCGWMSDAMEESSDDSTEVAADDGDDDSDDEAAPTGGSGGGGGGSVCSRMAACCRAYVAAMSGSIPASTCDAYNNVENMPDSMCTQTMAGYRAGLQAMQKAVPADCN